MSVATARLGVISIIKTRKIIFLLIHFYIINEHYFVNFLLQDKNVTILIININQTTCTLFHTRL